MLIATDTGVVEIDGVPYSFTRGVTRLRADHPIVKAAAHVFKPIDSSYPEIEQMTAAPGEKRGG
jgi:hypothetical protein